MVRLPHCDTQPGGAGWILALASALSILIVSPAWAQRPDSLPPGALKRLSLEAAHGCRSDLRLAEPGKAVRQRRPPFRSFPGRTIRRSGATSIPEALRLAPNLQVAQVNASQWAVSARGFSNVLANKLLVLIDGRTVYTPLYAGVFWDVQAPPLESIDRIEVVSGPGGALWGANAVNGVINIITRSATETQPFMPKLPLAPSCRASASCATAGAFPPALPFEYMARVSADRARSWPVGVMQKIPGAWARAASGWTGTQAGRTA